MEPVLVHGDGVAAYCAFNLLASAGVPAAFERPVRPRLPVIMLSEAAIHLIADVFGHKDLFRNLPRIRSRSVLWGDAREPVTVPHSAVVVSEETLLDQLRPEAASVVLSGAAGWQVYAARPLPPNTTEHGFGSRVAHATAVELRGTKESGCWVESTANGWLFLIGNQAGSGWLLSVGEETQDALSKSRLVAPQIETVGIAGGTFPCFPRIAAPLAHGSRETGWLACGTAAIAFDPICGDGTAHAVREAILGTAVLRSIANGDNVDELLAHYQSRLLAGFHRHLENCEGFYRTGGSSSWWRGELDGVEQGLSWSAKRLSEFPQFRYRLNGFDLELVA